LLNFWQLSQICSLDCPPFIATPFPTMNIETFKHQTKQPIHVSKQSTKNQPTHTPTTHSKGKTLSK